MLCLHCFVLNYHAKTQKNTFLILKNTKKHPQNAFFNNFYFVMSNLFRTFAVAIGVRVCVQV